MKKTIKKAVATATVPTAPASAPAPLKAAPVKTAVKAGPVKTPMVTPAASMSVVPAPAVRQSVGPARASNTTIEVKIDVGFGNRLFLRGQGEGLSWDRGIPLECVDSQTWRLIVPAKDKLQFKLLINDSVWAKGEDVVVTPGKRVEIVPAF